MDRERRDRIAQWAFDTHPILDRFHLWLEDVEVEVETAGRGAEMEAFTGASIQRAFVMATAVTALGTRLFGRWGEGAGLAREAVDRVKKDADAVSAYAMSEALWYLTRSLPENHAVMVSLGEGLMPKAGETPDMGSNPLLGFGRVYARPQVARFLDRRVHRLLNDAGYGWDGFWQDLQDEGVTVWGAAIDTLENTGRFAKGKPTGPMTVLHVFDQPLTVAKPYEGYLGALVLPREVVRRAEADSRLLAFHAPRSLVLESVRRAYPDVPPERVHVWTLGGPSREGRLGALWREWRELGVHVVEDGWTMPGGGDVFTDSGTYAPVARVGALEDDDGRRHVFLTDGYAASAEAIQAASLDPILDTCSCLTFFSSEFTLPVEREREVMLLDPDDERYPEALRRVAGDELDDERIDDETAERYRRSLETARDAGMPLGERHVTVGDFFPKRRWRVLALSGAMLPDPYTGMPGVEEVGDRTYRVAVRAATRLHVRRVSLTLRLRETMDESRLVFSPLLDRFASGQDHRSRPVKVSDSGRIRNELQTLCSEALEYLPDDRIRVHFSRIGDALMSAEKRAVVRDVLDWYCRNHPLWFRWLELAD